MFLLFQLNKCVDKEAPAATFVANVFLTMDNADLEGHPSIASHSVYLEIGKDLTCPIQDQEDFQLSSSVTQCYKTIKIATINNFAFCI